MEHNNSGIVKQQNNEYKELVEKVHTKQADNCTYNQQSLKECGSYIQDDNVILQSVQCSSQIQPASFSTSLVSNHSNQEYTATEQNLNAQTFIKIEPVASPRSISPQRIIPAPLKYQANSLSIGSTLSPSHSQVITAAVPKISDTQENEMKVVPKISDTQENEMKVVPKISDTQENEMKNTPKPNVTMCANLKPIELTKSTKSSPSGFRAVEFVLKNLDSVPGEEKFYSWSDKAKDFANTQLSEKSRERLKISSNIANSNNSQSTSVVMAEQTDLSRDKPSKRKSSSRRMNKVLKNANWAAEKDRTLKKYANHLMRKKPKSWQLQERIVDEDLSPYI